MAEKPENQTVEISRDWRPEERLTLIGLIVQDLITEEGHPRDPKTHFELVDSIDKIVHEKPEFLEANRSNFAKYLAVPKS